ncbi:hypothetical protein UPYG_G00084840, partial [Umbra pygmaea]
MDSKLSGTSQTAQVDGKNMIFGRPPCHKQPMQQQAKQHRDKLRCYFNSFLQYLVCHAHFLYL